MPTQAHDQHDTHIPRHARSRRRWPWLLTGGLVLVLLAAVGVIVRGLTDESGSPGPAAGPPATDLAAGPKNGRTADPNAPACNYRLTPSEDFAPLPPSRATVSGLVPVKLRTNRGPISLELDAAKAPCTVNSFVSLASGGYFTDSTCHRLTVTMLFVVQCGDPTATGGGTPGYRFDDENLPIGTAPAYPRGTIAMANSGPDTNGSQFFMVYLNSDIDPNYTVFGRVTDGLEILDRVAAGGTTGTDGPPNLELIIEGVEIS